MTEARRGLAPERGGLAFELAGARAVGMSPVFVSGVMAELWPERIQERLAQCDHHVRSIPEVLALIGVQEAPGGGGCTSEQSVGRFG